MNWLLSRTKGDFVIWGIVFTLSLFGVLAVYSSTGTLAYKRYSGNTELLLAKHMFFVAYGYRLYVPGTPCRLPLLLRYCTRVAYTVFPFVSLHALLWF
jgi:cell division protein FtsW (lipid II flippase)